MKGDYCMNTYFIILAILQLSLISLKMPGLEHTEESNIKTAYKNLDPKSVLQHFALSSQAPARTPNWVASSDPRSDMF